MYLEPLERGEHFSITLTQKDRLQLVTTGFCRLVMFLNLKLTANRTAVTVRIG